MQPSIDILKILCEQIENLNLENMQYPLGLDTISGLSNRFYSFFPTKHKFVQLLEDDYF